MCMCLAVLEEGGVQVQCGCIVLCCALGGGRALGMEVCWCLVFDLIWGES